MREGDLDRAADLAARENGYNPRTATRDEIRTLLDAAFAGRRPEL
jgi:hypothetical protein